MPWTDGLIALSVRWIHPIQQHGRRIPWFSSDITRLTCSSLVFCCLTVTVQQIHSFRASGVRVCHADNADLSAMSAFLRSEGSLCAVPLEIFMGFIIYQQFITTKLVFYFNSKLFSTFLCCQLPSGNMSITEIVFSRTVSPSCKSNDFRFVI